MDRLIQVLIYFVLTRQVFSTTLHKNIFYRRKHKKGQEEEQTKKRTRRAQKFQRAIVGASLTDIMAKRNMKPEIRKAQREQAIKYVFLLSIDFSLLQETIKKVLKE